MNKSLNRPVVSQSQNWGKCEGDFLHVVMQFVSVDIELSATGDLYDTVILIAQFEAIL